MRNALFVSLCGCLAATPIVSEPKRQLTPDELDRVTAGATSLSALDLGLGLGPGLVPGLVPSLPGFGIPCPSGFECSSTSTIDVAGNGNFVPPAIPTRPVTPTSPEIPNIRPITPIDPQIPIN